MPMPMSNWATPKDSANSPANEPSDCADRPKSVRRPSAMMDVTVLKAWLSAKPVSRQTSMAQAEESGLGPAFGAASAAL